MKIKLNRYLFLLFLVVLNCFAARAYSFDHITLGYIYNYSTKPWSLSFSIDYGGVTTEARRQLPYQKNLVIKVDPGQVLPLYYDSPCGAVSDEFCEIQGKLVISDFENKAFCYVIKGYIPYFVHRGVTGPVVLNENKPCPWDASIRFIGDSWSSWSAGGKDKPDLYFGATCSTAA